MNNKTPILLNDIIYPLNRLIEKEGISEYIRDYYSAVNGHLKMIYTEDGFYIAEDTTYQPWISVMGTLPQNITEQELHDRLEDYIKDDRYIAVYTNIEQVSAWLQNCKILTYHEDFAVAYLSIIPEIELTGIRIATTEDLPFIEETYQRSGHDQLFNRIVEKQIWVLTDENEIKGYAGIHKDGSLGFEYVAPDFRRQNIGTKMQFFVAKQMIKNNMFPYVMISAENHIAMNLQTKFGAHFANKLFCFFAKGSYEFE